MRRLFVDVDEIWAIRIKRHLAGNCKGEIRRNIIVCPEAHFRGAFQSVGNCVCLYAVANHRQFPNSAVLKIQPQRNRTVQKIDGEKKKHEQPHG